jgi:hypothetical protein
MKRGDWRLWIALLAAITFVGLILDARHKQAIDHRSDDNRVLIRWLEIVQRN